MLQQELVPRHLVHPSERTPIVVEEIRKPVNFRGAYILYEHLRLAWTTVWLKVTGRLTPSEFARRVRDFMVRLGPVWIQAGKIISIRSDLVPAEFAMELAELRDFANGFPFHVTKQIIEEELQAPLETHFEEFDEVPFSASTGFQLHRARLRQEDAWVAVKVQRPYVEAMYRKDIKLIKRVSRWLQFLRIQPRMRWAELSREIDEQTGRELDYRFEASSLRDLSRTLPDHGIYSPEVFFQYSTQRVIVMEYIHGVLVSDFFRIDHRDPDRTSRWMEENNVQPRKVARRLYNSVWRQVFEDNLFHADLHQENIILLRDSRLAIIDCRTVGSLEYGQLIKHRMFVRALARGEYSTAAERSFLLADQLPLVDLGEVKSRFVRVWRRWETRNYVKQLPVEEKSLTFMLYEINRIMYQYNFVAHWSMARLARTLINVDVSILQFAEGVNFRKWLAHYFRDADQRAKRIKFAELVLRTTGVLDSLQKLPRTVIENSVSQQEVLRRQVQLFQGSTSKTSYLLAVLYGFAATVVALVIVVMSLVFLRQHHALDDRLQSALGPQLSSVIARLDASLSFSYTMWMLLLIIAVYMYARTVAVKRRCLRHDLTPGARQADAVG